MQSIIVKRYSNPKAVGYAGWIEPEDKGWIAFVDLDGRPQFFLNRDPVTGAVLSDDPARHEAEIAEIRAEQARRDSFVEPVEGVVYPVLEGETHCDAAVPPTVVG